MSSGKRITRILDGEQIFKHYYITMGDGRSYNKLVAWATTKWGLSPYTGKKWTTGAVWQSAWRWAFDNLDYAKKIYRDVSFKYYTEVEKRFKPDAVWSEEKFEEEWLSVLAQHAKTCMTKAGYRKFVAKHPEVKPYEVL